MTTRRTRTTAPPAAAPPPVEQEKDPFLIGRFRFNPNWVQNHWSDAYFAWLVVISLAVWYNLIFILPRSVFHEIQESAIASIVFAVLDYACDMLYLGDIVMRILTGYMDNGILVREPRKLLKKYIYGSGIYMDILCIIPTDLLYIYTGWQAPYPLFRLNRILKMGRVGEFYHRAQTRLESPNTFRLLYLIAKMVVLVHINACLYYAVSNGVGIGMTRWAYPGKAGWRYENEAVGAGEGHEASGDHGTDHELTDLTMGNFSHFGNDSSAGNDTVFGSEPSDHSIGYTDFTAATNEYIPDNGTGTDQNRALTSHRHRRQVHDFAIPNHDDVGHDHGSAAEHHDYPTTEALGSPAHTGVVADKDLPALFQLPQERTTLHRGSRTTTPSTHAAQQQRQQQQQHGDMVAPPHGTSSPDQHAPNPSAHGKFSAANHGSNLAVDSAPVVAEGHALNDSNGNSSNHGDMYGNSTEHGGNSTEHGGEEGGVIDHEGGEHKKPIRISPEFVNDTLYQKYSYSMYWSVKMMTSKPYEIANPQKTYEFLFHLLDAFMGILLFASIVGEVDGIIESINKKSDDFKSHLDSVKQYISMRRVGKEMESRVVKWFDYIWSVNGSLDEESVLAILPEKLRMEIAKHVHLDVLKKVPIFQGIDEQFLLELAEKLKFEAFCPSDYICRRGDIGRDIYVIRRGLLNIIGPDGVKVIVTLKAGAVFGELSLLNVPGSLNGNRRTVTVRAVGYAELFSLSKEDFWTSLEEYPDVRDQLMAKAKLILQKDNMINENAAREQARRGRNFQAVADKMEENLETVMMRMDLFRVEQADTTRKLVKKMEVLEEKQRTAESKQQSLDILGTPPNFATPPPNHAVAVNKILSQVRQV